MRASARAASVSAFFVLLGAVVPACSGTSDSSTGSSSGGTGGASGSGGSGGADAGAECGNGVLEGTERCDDGNQIGADGCETTCDFTCTSDAKCSDGDACNGAETCDLSKHTCSTGTQAADGTSCGSNGEVCVGGLCQLPACGDNQTQTGEECDDGNATNGDGCDSCKFSCLSTDSARNCASSSGDECAGTASCADTTHTCLSGLQLPDDTACNSGAGKCKSGICTSNNCGNSTIDTGETCDPPNGSTCDTQCQTIVPVVCGDGAIGGTEQCDDGNTANLDGCDSACKYEVIGRMTKVAIQGGASPSFCTPTTNHLGKDVVTGTALGQLNTPLQDGINKGSTNIMVQTLGLDDLTGVADPALTLGILTGSTDPAKGTWPTTPANPIDWWFLVEPNVVDASGLPTGILTNGVLSARNLTAGPSNVDLTLLLAGSPAVLKMTSARVNANIDGSPAPDVPAPPPAVLASGLNVFQTITADGTGQGLCGNITIESLAQIPIPEVLTTGATACGNCSGSHAYTYCGADLPVGPGCNSLLDALVGGCKVTLCLVKAINTSQPDVAGSDGNLSPLTLGAGNKVPDTQTTGNDDAYSAYMKFRANRAHITGKKP